MECRKDIFVNKQVNTPKDFFILSLSKNQDDIDALKDKH
jgi:hypothetical protein